MAKPTPNKYGVYEIRLTVPKELHAIIGKKVLRRTLKTKLMDEAKKAYSAVYQKLQDIIDDGYLQAEAIRREEINPVTETDIDDAVDAWGKKWAANTKELAERYLVIRHSGEIDDPCNDVIMQCLDDLERLEFNPEMIIYEGARASLIENAKQILLSSMSAEIEEALALQDLPLNSYWRIKLAIKLALKRLEITRYAIESVSVEGLLISYKSRVNALKGQSNKYGLSVEPSNAAKSPTCLSEIFKLYEETLLIREPLVASKRIIEYTPAIQRFAELHGDIDVKTITKANIVDYRRMLEHFPRYPKKAIAELPLKDKLEKTKSLGLPCLSATTVKNTLKGLSAVLQFAVIENILDSNPAHGLPKVKAARKKATNPGYMASEITAIFMSSMFRERLSLYKGEASYWIPIIAYYTGARLEEIAQLRRCDVADIDGIYSFKISDEGEGQSVKNDSSVRDVPLHSHLIELGFLDYIEQFTDRIFPELERGSKGKLSHYLSRWWGKHIREKIGITRKIDRPMHAFRHTFATFCRTAGIREDVENSITGWTQGSTGRNYGIYPIEVKRDVIEAIPWLPIERVDSSNHKPACSKGE